MKITEWVVVRHMCNTKSDGTAAASYVISKSGEKTIDVEVVALDETINGSAIFIKMDIEGSKLEALKEAKKLITTYKPKLEVSAYYKLEDMVDLVCML